MELLNFDANASHRPLPEVIERIYSLFGKESLNPSSIHQGGQRARYLIEEARAQVASLIGIESAGQIIFTSGASEANSLAILQPLLRGISGKVVASKVEHPSVLEPLKYLKSRGFEIDLIAPEADGRILTSNLVDAVNQDTCLVSLMAVNNETGAIYPLTKAWGQVRAKSPEVLIHSDCAQMVGKLPLDFTKLQVDMLSISGHKFGALMGVGALAIRNGIELKPLIMGGAQEYSIRAGTENLLGIVSLGLAAHLAVGKLNERSARQAELRDFLEQSILNALPWAELNPYGTQRLSNTTNLYFHGVSADDLVVALDTLGLCISAGSACSSGKPQPSHVLLSHGLSVERASSSVRLSLEFSATKDEVSKAISLIVSAVNRMRGSHVH